VKENIETSTRELKQAHLITTALSLGFVVISVAFVGGFSEHLMAIIIGAAILVVPFFLIHQLLCAWMLEPVRLLLRRPEGAAAPAGMVQRAVEVIEMFSFREALLSIVMWIFAGAALVVGLNFLQGMTPWQIFVACALVLAGGLVKAVFGSYANHVGLRAIRSAVEGIVGKDVRPRTAPGTISRKLTISFAVILIVALGLASLMWLSRVREQKGRLILAEREASFRQAASKLEKSLLDNPKIGPREALRESNPPPSLKNNLVIVDGQGKVLVGTPLMDSDPVWFTRILKSDAPDWNERRAPFLYISRKVAEGRHLLWVAPITLVYETIDPFFWKGVAGVLVILVVCLLLAGSVAWSASRPYRRVAEQLRQLARGDRDTLTVLGGGGELTDLVRAVEEWAGSMGQMLNNAFETTDNLSREHGKLVEQVGRFRDAAERRGDIAEQTATSVVEMRSAIQSISEQMESLKEASSDCSSAMFEIDQSVREVAASSENFQGLVDDTASALSQMTASMDEVAGNVDELAGAAEDTVASIAVIDGSIKQVEENTNQTQRLSEEVSEFASRGASSVRETIAGINEIQEITDEAREVINRLGTQMEAVGRILTVIGDVAEQTNLLALNAAIIAAAAGEHGKGFAVVADEIKDLADRTSTSTKEIAGLIRSVQTESRRAIDAMQRGSGSVRRGVELANHAGEALQQILSSVEQVTEMAKDIAKTTAEHSTITRNITKSMTNISSMVRQIKRAVTEQSTSGSRVNRVSEQMRDDARFVFRSANEQVQAATGVTKNMERISEMVSFVSKAMSEQSNGVNHVAKVAEEVRDTIEQERAQIADLEEITDKIGRQAGEFSRYLENFDKEGERE
jgi:methyl-accepting chemotaxis protein